MYIIDFFILGIISFCFVITIILLIMNDKGFEQGVKYFSVNILCILTFVLYLLTINTKVAIL